MEQLRLIHFCTARHLGYRNGVCPNLAKWKCGDCEMEICNFHKNNRVSKSTSTVHYIGSQDADGHIWKKLV